MKDTILSVTEALLRHETLSRQQIHTVMHNMMSGNAQDVQIAGFLTALRAKGESVDEITAAAEVLREKSSKVTVSGPLLDIVGTGGGKVKTFNVSTASAFIAAAAGARVAKHGNRSASSPSGAADFLEAAGANLDLTPDQVAYCIEHTDLGFIFAANHHASMRYVANARKSLGFRTIFNLIGPLSNPASASHYLLGVFDHAWVNPIANVLKNLSVEKALVVNANPGLDELSIAGESTITELNNGHLTTYTVVPEDFGLRSLPLNNIQADSPQSSFKMIQLGLKELESDPAQMLALNAGAAIYAADLVLSLQQGVDMAQDMIATGLAYEKMQAFVHFTQQLTYI